MLSYLEFQNLEKRYGPVAALSAVNLAIEQGSFVGLLGPNGAGKSTLFACLLGLTRPTAGQISLRGSPVTQATRQLFGYTPERVALYPQESLWENGRFFAQLRGHDAAELEQQLERVGLAKFKSRKVRQLSKGMLQRLALAIALCGQPELLILDEPFNGLDPVRLDDLREILRAEHERGATLIVSTHTISSIEPLASHIAVLLDGRLSVFAPLEDLHRRYPGAGSLEQIYSAIAREQFAGAAEGVAA